MERRPVSRRVRVRVPSVAPGRRGPTDKAPDYESGGCRFDSCRRHHLAVAQRSRAPPSEGGGRTFESCRRGRLAGHAGRDAACGVDQWRRRGRQEDQALVAQEVERVPGTDEVVVRIPPRAPRKGSGQMRSPFARGYGSTALVGASPHPFRPRSALAAMVERSRHRALNPEAGVRFPVAVLTHTDARARRSGASARRTGRRSGVDQCQVVERQDVRLLPGRRGFEPLPGSARESTLGGRGVQAAWLQVVEVRVRLRTKFNARWPRSSARGCKSWR